MLDDNIDIHDNAMTEKYTLRMRGDAPDKI